VGNPPKFTGLKTKRGVRDGRKRKGRKEAKSRPGKKAVQIKRSQVVKMITRLDNHKASNVEEVTRRGIG